MIGSIHRVPWRAVLGQLLIHYLIGTLILAFVSPLIIARQEVVGVYASSYLIMPDLNTLAKHAEHAGAFT